MKKSPEQLTQSVCSSILETCFFPKGARKVTIIFDEVPEKAIHITIEGETTNYSNKITLEKQ